MKEAQEHVRKFLLVWNFVSVVLWFKHFIEKSSDTKTFIDFLKVWWLWNLIRKSRKKDKFDFFGNYSFTQQK